MKKKTYLVSIEELESLNLSREVLDSILETKNLGYRMGISKGMVESNLNDKGIKIINPVNVVSLDPRSALNQIRVNSGDLILGINGMSLSTEMGGEPVLLTQHGSAMSYSNYIKKIDVGEQIKIMHGRIRISEDSLSRMDHRQNHRIEVKETFMTASFLYDLRSYPELVETLENRKIYNLPKRVKSKLFNQDHAVDQVNKSIKIFFAGLKEDDKPIGGYLCLGPTGTGKTELAKILSKELDFKLVRIDMSEYGESHNIARLLGSPPGYAGFNKPTVLEEEIGDSGTKAILLLDEFEKAHSDIQKTFLQVLDNKELTLGNGNKINFGNVLILMTSNAGITQKSNIGIAANSQKSKPTVDMAQIRKLLLPEFLGRLNGVIEFNALEESHAEQILDKFIEEFNQRLFWKKKVIAEFSVQLKKHLVKIGFNQTYGARPLKNILADKVYEKIADTLLFSSNLSKSNIRVGIEGEEITVRVQESSSMNTFSKTKEEILNDN